MHKQRKTEVQGFLWRILVNISPNLYKNRYNVRYHWSKWAWECSRLFSLLATRDVSRGAERRLRFGLQKSILMTFFAPDSGQRALICRRSIFIFSAIVYELQTKVKRSQGSNVNAMNLLKPRSIWASLRLVRDWRSRNCTIIDQTNQENDILLEPTGKVLYWISMVFFFFFFFLTRSASLTRSTFPGDKRSPQS